MAATKRSTSSSTREMYDRRVAADSSSSSLFTDLDTTRVMVRKDILLLLECIIRWHQQQQRGMGVLQQAAFLQTMGLMAASNMAIQGMEQCRLVIAWGILGMVAILLLLLDSGKVLGSSSMVGGVYMAR